MKTYQKILTEKHSFSPVTIENLIIPTTEEYLQQVKKHILSELNCNYSLMVEMCFDEISKYMKEHPCK